jgi:hypothetical protein
VTAGDADGAELGVGDGVFVGAGTTAAGVADMSEVAAACPNPGPYSVTGVVVTDSV